MISMILIVIVGLILWMAISVSVRPPESDCLLTSTSYDSLVRLEDPDRTKLRGIGFLFQELRKTNPDLIDYTEQGEPRLLLTPEAKQRVASIVEQADLTDELRAKIGHALLCRDVIVWTDASITIQQGASPGKFFVPLAARTLSRRHAHRYAEEWAAELAIIPHGRDRIQFLVGIFWASIKLRFIMRRGGKPTRRHTH